MTNPPHGSALTTADPVVSVIIPAYNVGEWIGQTVESLQAQELRELEVLLVDDGSTDSTVERYLRAADGDPRFQVLQNQGKGAAKARNLAVSRARGEFLAFSDADDVVPSHAYRTLVEQARSSGAEMVVGNHLIVEPQQLTARSQSVPIYDRVRVGRTILQEPRYLRDRVCWNRIIRRSTWQSLGLAFADSRRSNDILAMTQAYTALSFDVVPEPVYIYRRRVGTTSMTASRHLPGPLRDHFEQELACSKVVERMRDRRLSVEYFAGILEFDIWAHGVVAIESDEPEFDHVRHLLVELVTSAPRAAYDRLPLRPRLVYGLVARRRWELAAALLSPRGVDGALKVAELLPGREVQAILAADPGAHEALGDLVRTAILAPLADESLDEATVRRLHAAAAEMHAAGIADVVFSRSEVQALRLPSDTPAEQIREAVRAATPAGGLARMAVTARSALGALSHGDVSAVLAVAREVRPRHLATVAREVRPRHFAIAARRLAGAVRRRLRPRD